MCCLQGSLFSLLHTPPPRALKRTDLGRCSLAFWPATCTLLPWVWCRELPKMIINQGCLVTQYAGTVTTQQSSEIRNMARCSEPQNQLQSPSLSSRPLRGSQWLLDPTGKALPAVNGPPPSASGTGPSPPRHPLAPHKSPEKLRPILNLHLVYI